MSDSPLRLLTAVLRAVAVAAVFFIAGCADDPILGPDDGTSDGGGSYGVIQRLAPDDSVRGDSTFPQEAQDVPGGTNPDTF